mmetsp:Transcript_17006/g.39247  ORF Transcript_17006/g.39247 Transcript_17006/m.39247 type:complete len:1504 (+) Transcript_17006:311-4822(+)|eukprot:CAMPEP_0197188034 /NCGR_PEP_ID=MMETSP1423-20130617/17059_1 /TAXON_ID=476441 /ORGANISM="Pseudo-nitzschia heimii, Strain UNC1101" /LENGTH=1503 /DNA_ID=CAMNT_0042639771 /DNA_START=280 /DNA_END=4791 /DNA_ORIENTATION=+
MKIPLLNLRKKREGKCESPLKSDPILAEILSRLQAINDYGSFETWRCEFLKRFMSFLVDEGIERSEQSHNVRLRIKVDKLIRNISKIAHHVNDGSLSSAQVTVPARNSLDDGMKSCEDLSRYLKLLSPIAECDEAIAGFSNFSIAAVLVQTGFKEYERLNMCRDILQVLRENFVNLVAEPKHLAAFDKYEQGLISFKSIVLEDVGLLPVLKKQRQLKSPDPPKALMAEIRRGILREALISKSMEGRHGARANKISQETSCSRRTGVKSDSNKSRVDKIHELKESNHNSEVSANTENASTGKAIDQEQSFVDEEQDNTSRPLVNGTCVEYVSMNEVMKTKRSRKKGKSRSPLRPRPTTRAKRRPLKQSTDDAHELSMCSVPSNPTNLNSNSSDSHLTSNHTENDAKIENGDGDERLRTVQMHSPRNNCTPEGEVIKGGTRTIEDSREGKNLSFLHSLSSKEPIIDPHESGKAKRDLVIHGEGRDLTPTDNIKNNSKRVRKGKQTIKNAVRERNIATTGRGRRGLRKSNFSVEAIPVIHEKSKKPIGFQIEEFKIEKMSQDSSANSSNGKKSPPKNARNNAHIGSAITKFLTESVKCTKEIPVIPKDGPNEMQKKKKSDRSKLSKHKKISQPPNDYKKIIHGKAYSINAKKELPVVDIRLSSPAHSALSYIQESSQTVDDDLADSESDKTKLNKGEEASSNILSSLLDNCTSLNCEDDDLINFPGVSLDQESDCLRTKRGKTDRRQQLLGHILSESASISFNNGTMQSGERAIKAINHDDESVAEKPSFYENFIKPLTVIEQDVTVNNGGKLFHEMEHWEKERDIFEDRSVCSSKYRGRTSIANAKMMLNLEDSVMELLRLDISWKREDETEENQYGRGTEANTSSSDIGIEESMTETLERLKRKNTQKRRIEQIKQSSHYSRESSVYDNKDEYDANDQTKEILTAEEEAVRMANEVAKLQSILKGDFDFDALHDGEEVRNMETDECKWKFKESEDMDLIYEEEKEIMAIDDVSWKFKEEDEGLNAIIGTIQIQSSEAEQLKNPIGFDYEYDGGTAAIVAEKHDDGSGMSGKLFESEGVENRLMTTFNGKEDNKFIDESGPKSKGDKESDMVEMKFGMEGVEHDMMPNRAKLEDENESNVATEEDVFRLKERNDGDDELGMVHRIETNENELHKNCATLDEEKEKANTAPDENTDDLEGDYQESENEESFSKHEDKSLKKHTDLDGEELDLVEDTLKREANEDKVVEKELNSNMTTNQGIWKGGGKFGKTEIAVKEFVQEATEHEHELKATIVTSKMTKVDQNFNIEEKVCIPLGAEDKSDDEREKGNTVDSDDECNLREYNEELEMMEKMLQLEAGENAEEPSHFKVNERSLSRDFEGLWTNAPSMADGMEGGSILASKSVNRFPGTSRRGEQSNETIPRASTKESNYPFLSSIYSKDIIPVIPRGKDSPKGITSRHARPRGIGRPSIVPGRSLRALDSGTRLSRWQVPKNDFSRSSSYRNIKS